MHTNGMSMLKFYNSKTRKRIKQFRQLNQYSKENNCTHSKFAKNNNLMAKVRVKYRMPSRTIPLYVNQSAMCAM
jgi:hypothetical protein